MDRNQEKFFAVTFFLYWGLFKYNVTTIKRLIEKGDVQIWSRSWKGFIKKEIREYWRGQNKSPHYIWSAPNLKIAIARIDCFFTSH